MKNATLNLWQVQRTLLILIFYACPLAFSFLRSPWLVVVVARAKACGDNGGSAKNKVASVKFKVTFIKHELLSWASYPIRSMSHSGHVPCSPWSVGRSAYTKQAAHAIHKKC